MKRGVLIIAAVLFWPYIARADTPVVREIESFPANCSAPAPDISGWEVVFSLRTEFRISDRAVAYLGLAIEYTDYRSPLVRGEFVRIFSRHIPLISEQKDLSDRVILDVATKIYTQKEEQDRLGEFEKEVDPFLIVKWKTKENPRTGEDNARDGAADVWFLKSTEECLVTQLINSDDKIRVEFLTENVGDGKPRNVFVGVLYGVEDAYHILKVDRRDVLLLTNGGER